jgi:hypothetical protein
MRMIRRVVLVCSRWWYKWTTTPGYRARVRRTTLTAVVVVVLSIVVAKLLWGNRGPGFFSPLVYAALFFAAAILFAVTILSSDEFVDELEASHPPRVRNRAGFVRHAKRTLRVLSAGIKSVDAMLTRTLTRESIARWSSAIGEVLCGIPPVGATPAGAGPLGRPVPAPSPAPPPARVPAPVPAPQSTERRHRRQRRGVLDSLTWPLPSRRSRRARRRNRTRSAPTSRNRRRSSSRTVALVSDPRNSRSRSRRAGT